MRWSADGIFIGQGKYAVEILKRFRMMDYMEMTAPMASNLKLLSDASSEKETRHMLCGEHPEPVPDGSETCSPSYFKACIELPEGYS